MSRRYCLECRAPHNNPWGGLCADCSAGAEDVRAEARREKDLAFAVFMALPEADRWEAVFNHIYEGQKP